MSKKLLGFIPFTSVGLVACANQSVTETTQNLTDTLNQVPLPIYIL